VTVEMSIRERYLKTLDHVRARFHRMSLGHRRVLVAAYVFVFLVVIMSVGIAPFGYLVEVGKPSPRTIIAPKTVQYIDKARTADQRNVAAAAIENVYITNKQASVNAQNNISDFFKAVGEVDAQALTPDQKAAEIINRTKTTLPASEIVGLLSLTPDQRASAQLTAKHITAVVMGGVITPDVLARAREQAKNLAVDPLTDAGVQGITAAITAANVIPNTRFDKLETDRRKQAARDGVKEVVTTRLQGEVVVSKGEVVTEDEVELLKSLGFTRSTLNPSSVLYTAIFVILLFAALGMFLARYNRIYWDSPGLLTLMGSLVIAYTVVAKFLTVASRSWSPFWGYLMPAAAVTMMAAILFDSGVAIVLAIACALITGIVTAGNFSLVAFALLGAFLPVLIVTRFSTRHELRRAGMYTAFWVALVAFGASAITGLNQGLLANTGAGLLNGAVCTIITLGTLPFLETTFRVTTNTWLLELASPDQKLLKELSLKAPGTYSHSIMVANLAEAAANEIGSDQMLARVSAYYHDVGKMLRPQFFIENQPEGASLHSNIRPNLSAIIITSHVRDGVEMLEENHIPPDLVDIVRQHHGTSLVRYFYEKAIEEADGEPVDENRFRYHFEKPRRRTSGILMLADSVEAAARAQQKPSAALIGQTVERVVNSKLEDGQLDECDLTFSDIVKIKKVFARMLIAAYHPRVDYPAPLAIEKRNGRKNTI
jgi:putative nucleotidyltransferase with HDIG domain